MKGNIFHTIEEKLPSFSKGKQQIASYILANPNDAAFQTAAQIGKSVKISESTVVRFAGDLGYKGFPDFQKALQKEVRSLLQKERTLSTESGKCHGPGDIITDWSRGEESLYDQLQPGNPSAAKDAVEELSRCRALYLLSTPLGKLLTPFCRYAGELTLDTVFCLSLDSKERLFAGMSLIAPGDLVLALALGEISPLYIFAIEQCKKMGARVLMITDSIPGDLPSTDNLTLKVPTLQTEGVPNLTPGMNLVYGLFTLSENQRAQESDHRKKIIKEIWDTYDKFQT